MKDYLQSEHTHSTKCSLSLSKQNSSKNQCSVNLNNLKKTVEERNAFERLNRLMETFGLGIKTHSTKSSLTFENKNKKVQNQ